MMEVSRDMVDIKRRIDLLGVSGMVARDPNKQGCIIRDVRWRTCKDDLADGVGVPLQAKKTHRASRGNREC